MQDSKDVTWNRDHDEAADAVAEAEHNQTTQAGTEPESDGWQQYRRWISKAPAPPRNRRAGVDPSLYSWREYRNWTEQVKRKWHDNS